MKLLRVHSKSGVKRFEFESALTGKIQSRITQPHQTPSQIQDIQDIDESFGRPLYDLSVTIVKETAKPGAGRPIVTKYWEAAKVVVDYEDPQSYEC